MCVSVTGYVVWLCVFVCVRCLCMFVSWIKSVSWEYTYDKSIVEEYKGKILEYSLLLAVLPRNRLHPVGL